MRLSGELSTAQEALLVARDALAAADVARQETSAGEEDGVRMGEALREAEEGWRVARVERDAGKVCLRKVAN